MRAREHRQPVLIGARLRAQGLWGDAQIRNVSSRGMLIHMRVPPPRGAYVEIARGRVRLAGRVAWSESARCGIQLREKVEIGRLAAEEIAVAAPAAAGTAGPRPERRQAPRDARAVARWSEFGIIAAFAAMLAGAMGHTAYAQVAQTMAAVEAKL